MQIDFPTSLQIPELLRLWKDAFGEHDGFWEMFLETAFTANHCRCITMDGRIAAALFWFDCSCEGQKIAYVYAVVTSPDYRGRGLCRLLLNDTQDYLAKLGYYAVMLVPEKESLRQMYRRLGYAGCTSVAEFACASETTPVPLRAVSPEEYGQLRRSFLPRGGVVQEGKNLDFLAAQVQFYAGEDFLLAAYAQDEELCGMELLGNREAAPGILQVLGFQKGRFRGPGREKAFAMIYPLAANTNVPTYFGFAFD